VLSQDLNLNSQNIHDKPVGYSFSLGFWLGFGLVGVCGVLPVGECIVTVLLQQHASLCSIFPIRRLTFYLGGLTLA
jgi:hypothetical protein